MDVRGEYNQIANYAYTQSEINIAIKADAPCEYMAKVLKQIETKEPTIGGIIEKELAESEKKQQERIDKYTAKYTKKDEAK